MRDVTGEQKRICWEDGVVNSDAVSSLFGSDLRCSVVGSLSKYRGSALCRNT